MVLNAGPRDLIKGTGRYLREATRFSPASVQARKRNYDEARKITKDLYRRGIIPREIYRRAVEEVVLPLREEYHFAKKRISYFPAEDFYFGQ